MIWSIWKWKDPRHGFIAFQSWAPRRLWCGGGCSLRPSWNCLVLAILHRLQRGTKRTIKDNYADQLWGLVFNKQLWVLIFCKTHTAGTICTHYCILGKLLKTLKLGWDFLWHRPWILIGFLSSPIKDLFQPKVRASESMPVWRAGRAHYVVEGFAPTQIWAVSTIH